MQIASEIENFDKINKQKGIDTIDDLSSFGNLKTKDFDDEMSTSNDSSISNDLREGREDNEDFMTENSSNMPFDFNIDGIY